MDQKELEKEKLKNSLELLKRSGCPWTPKVLENVKVTTLLDWACNDENSEDLAFHPNGCCGCVVVLDDYIFGIRCDHLMWMLGEHESHKGTGVLLLGNHKGTLVLKFLHE